MSKSEGNFYTLRDLLLKGHQGVGDTVSAAERALPAPDELYVRGRWRRRRMRSTGCGRFMRGCCAAGLRRVRMRRCAAATAKAAAEFTAALANDLNTAEAAAAISEMVRAANSAADAGTLGEENAAEILRVLALFDGVFAVLVDRDAELTRAALAWAEAEGRIGEAAPELVAQMGLSDEEIDALVAERTAAKKARNFARADAIRAELLGQGRGDRGLEGRGAVEAEVRSRLRLAFEVQHRVHSSMGTSSMGSVGGGAALVRERMTVATAMRMMTMPASSAGARRSRKRATPMSTAMTGLTKA